MDTHSFGLWVARWCSPCRGSDLRQLATLLPVDEDGLSTVFLFLEEDLHDLRTSLSNPSPRPFKLTSSALLSLVKLLLSALHTQDLTHDHTTTNCTELRLTMLAWHYIAHNAHAFGTMVEHAIEARTLSFQTALQHILGTNAPPPTFTLHARVTCTSPQHLSTTPQSFRVSTYLHRAMVLAPEAFELHRALNHITTGLISHDHKHIAFVTTPLAEDELPATWELPPLEPAGHTIIVTICNETLISLTAPSSLLPLRILNPRTSRFLPPHFHWRLPSEERELHDSRQQREGSPLSWFKARLRQSSPPPRQGRRPRVRLRPMPEFHASTVISRAARWRKRFKNFLGVAASTILSGVISWCPPACKPRCVSPLGVVPKKTDPFFRLIIDLRGPNEYMSRGACSKNLMGIRWRENYFVFNAPMFGGRLSGCIMCKHTWERACSMCRQLDQEFEDLGLLLNDKRLPPSQRGVRLLTRGMNALIGGPEDDEAWDEPVQLTPEAREEACLTTDASWEGWGASLVIRTSSGTQRRETSQAWQQGARGTRGL